MSGKRGKEQRKDERIARSQIQVFSLWVFAERTDTSQASAAVGGGVDVAAAAAAAAADGRKKVALLMKRCERPSSF